MGSPDPPVRVCEAVVVRGNLPVRYGNVHRGAIKCGGDLAFTRCVFPEAAQHFASPTVGRAKLAVGVVVVPVHVFRRVKDPCPVAIQPIRKRWHPICGVLTNPRLYEARANPATVHDNVRVVHVTGLLRHKVNGVSKGGKVPHAQDVGELLDGAYDDSRRWKDGGRSCLVRLCVTGFCLSLQHLFVRRVVGKGFCLVGVFLRRPMRVQVVHLRFHTTIRPIVGSIYEFNVTIAIGRELCTLNGMFLFVTRYVHLFPRPFPSYVLAGYLRALVGI